MCLANAMKSTPHLPWSQSLSCVLPKKDVSYKETSCKTHTHKNKEEITSTLSLCVYHEWFMFHVFYQNTNFHWHNVRSLQVIRFKTWFTILEDIQKIGSCCLYIFCYYHILSYFLGSVFYQYMVVFLFNTVIYVFLLLGLCILIVRLPWLRFYPAFSSAGGTARTLPKFLWGSMYCLLCV
jgi:hypothetical protein